MQYRKTCSQGSVRTSCRVLALAVAIAACLPTYAVAEEPRGAQETAINFDIPAGDLSVALERFSAQSGIQAMYRQELVEGKRSPTVVASLLPSLALERLIVDAGLTYERVNARTYVLKQATKPESASPQSAKEPRNESSMRGRQERNRTQDIDKIIVVGSRLGTSPTESALPIKVITREELDTSGAGSIAQALSNLSEIPINNVGDAGIGLAPGVGTGGNINSTTVQMRGLARGTTLILINGRRSGESGMFSDTGQFDLSTIPLALVERIEVLPAGSSAIYGGDGLAGVVNIVLREDARGFELRMRKTSIKGSGTSQASLMWGETWSKGNVTVIADWTSIDPLFNYQRDLTADQDFTRFGGRDLRQQNGNPGNVYSMDGCGANYPCYVAVDNRGALPGLNHPFAMIPEGQDGTSLNGQDFLSTQGKLRRTTPIRHLRSEEDRLAFSMKSNIEFSSALSATADLVYSRRTIPSFQIPLGTGGPYSDWVVPDTHPHNPFGVPVTVDSYYRDTGAFTSFKQTHIRGMVGLNGKLWKLDWDIGWTHARDKANNFGHASFSPNAVKEALADGRLNPFVGNDSLPASRDVVHSLLDGSSLDHGSETRTNVVTGYVRGPVFNTAAGTVVGLLGVEKSSQAVSIDSNVSSLLAKNVDGKSNGKAAFAEIRVPVLRPQTGAHYERLALTGALRTESSDRFESSTRTGTVGVEARPTKSLLIRATQSSAFKPLLTYSAAQQPIVFDSWISDPKFDPFDYYVIPVIIQGGVPDGLAPETSTTSTLGVQLNPSSSFDASVTVWETKFRDRIAYIDTDTMVANEDFYPGRVHRSETTGMIDHIDLRQVNIARTDSAGVDVAAAAHWDTRAGGMVAGMSATYTYKYSQQLTEDSPVTENVSVRSSGGWAPKWKIVPRLGWNPTSDVSATLVGRYVSRYKDPVALTSGSSAGEFKSLGDFWILDLNATFALDRLRSKRIYDGPMSISVGATNIFNRLPEFCASCGSAGYDTSQYDIYGRTIYAELRVGL